MKITRFFSSSVGKKSVMSITGFLLGCFLLLHLAGNTTVFLGRNAFISYATHLHSLGPIIHIFEAGLVTVFILHVFFALRLYIENLSARPERYAMDRSSGGRTFASRTMPYTGVLILIFIILHLKNFYFTDSSIPIADTVRTSLRNPVICLYYVVSLLILGIHTSHGFWSLFQSLGVNHPHFNEFLRQGAIIVSVLGAGVFMAIPIAAFLFNNFLL